MKKKTRWMLVLVVSMNFDIFGEIMVNEYLQLAWFFRRVIIIK